MIAQHPMNEASPSEWLMRSGSSQPPYAVIRRFLFGDPNRSEEWFRVVTWSPSSEARELVGWCRSFEVACGLGWDYKCASDSWQHHLAARRIDQAEALKRRPTAAELAKFYRKSPERF